MAQPVWTLSVDLQTKTATFQSGMSDAAKAARSSFAEIKDGANSMGSAVGHSATEARHSIMLLGEEFGVHLPRGVTMFIASLGPVAGAMEAAFPFLAIVAGATLLIEKLSKMGEDAAKSGKAWASISDDVQKWAETTKKELLEVAIQTDRLNGDKLKELQDTLKQIDASTLDHLKSEFDAVGKSVDAEMGKMHSMWITNMMGMGNGVQGVQEKFDAAMQKINADLASGNQKKLAADLKAASDEMWNLAAPTYDLVQRLHEAHNEIGANKIASAQWYQDALRINGIYGHMTDELRAQQALEKQKSDNATRTINPPEVINATDPRVAQERKKDFASYMETARQKAEADEKLADQRMTMEADVTRYFSAEYAKQAQLQEKLGAEAARHEIEMARLKESAREQADKHALAMHAENAKAATDEEIKAVNDALAVEVDGYNKQIAALDKYGADYTVKLNELNNKIQEIQQRAANQRQSIQDAADAKQAQEITRAYSTMADDVGRSLGQVLTRHEKFSKMVISLGDQVAQGLIENALKAMLADDMTKPHDAAAAARKAYLAGQSFPWPMNLIMPPALAAGAFASVMAFETGGIVPGVDNFDSVNAKLTPGEAVIPKALTEQLTNAAKFGNASNQPEQHVHVHSTYHVHAMDGASVERVLADHEDTFHKHFENHVRKMNR